MNLKIRNTDKPNEEQNDVLFYPNPVKNILNIKNDKKIVKQIALYNSYGSKIKDIKNTNLETVSIFVGDIPTGNYFIKCYTINNRVITKKIVVIH